MLTAVSPACTTMPDTQQGITKPYQNEIKIMGLQGRRTIRKFYNGVQDAERKMMERLPFKILIQSLLVLKGLFFQTLKYLLIAFLPGIEKKSDQGEHIQGLTKAL